MAVCTFFGHRDAPDAIKEKLFCVLCDLVENKGVTEFYVGNNGSFDYYVRAVLRKIKEKYPHTDYSVVLARLPERDAYLARRDFSDSIFPDELTSVPPRFAIPRRNAWMLSQAQYVVTYVTHIACNSFNMKEAAIKKKKTVIEISQI